MSANDQNKTTKDQITVAETVNLLVSALHEVLLSFSHMLLNSRITNDAPSCTGDVKGKETVHNEAAYIPPTGESESMPSPYFSTMASGACSKEDVGKVRNNNTFQFIDEGTTRPGEPIPPLNFHSCPVEFTTEEKILRREVRELRTIVKSQRTTIRQMTQTIENLQTELTSKDCQITGLSQVAALEETTHKRAHAAATERIVAVIKDRDRLAKEGDDLYLKLKEKDKELDLMSLANEKMAKEVNQLRAQVKDLDEEVRSRTGYMHVIVQTKKENERLVARNKKLNEEVQVNVLAKEELANRFVALQSSCARHLQERNEQTGIANERTRQINQMDAINDQLKRALGVLIEESRILSEALIPLAAVAHEEPSIHRYRAPDDCLLKDFSSGVLLRARHAMVALTAIRLRRSRIGHPGEGVEFPNSADPYLCLLNLASTDCKEGDLQEGRGS